MSVSFESVVGLAKQRGEQLRDAATDLARDSSERDPRPRHTRRRRAWISAALGISIFIPLFVAAVWTRQGLPATAEGAAEPSYLVALVATYVVITTVGALAVAHSVGWLVDSWTREWIEPDAAVAFAVLGVAASLVPMWVVGAQVGGGALVPMLWLFAVPMLVAGGLTRAWLAPVMRSLFFTRLVVGFAGVHVSVLLAYVVGLGVADGAMHG